MKKAIKAAILLWDEVCMLANKQKLKYSFFVLLTWASFSANAQAPGITPILVAPNSLNLPFAVDGHVVRQNTAASAPADWTTTAAQFPTGALFSPITGQGSTFPVTLTKHVVEPYYSNDDVFGSGAKANDNPNTAWTWVIGSAGNKSDMNNALVHVAADANNNTWAILAGDRLAQDGTSYLDFEFLQAPLFKTATGGFFTTASNTTGGRTPGDLLVTVEYVNGGLTPNIFYYRWLFSGVAYDWVSFTPGANSTYVANNATTTNVPYGAFGSTTYPPNAFVEAAVNITAYITNAVNDPCAGITFQTMFIKTKASNSASAALKDLIEPIQLSAKAGLSVTTSTGKIPCFGGTTVLNTTALMGTPPYQYSLNGGPYQSTSSWNVPAGGPYIVTVKDASNCTSSAASVTITQPVQLTVAFNNQTNIACYGGSNGTVTASPSGGKPPYQYSWNTTPAKTTATASGLSAGTYIVTVTDSSGCVVNQSVTITQPSAPLTSTISGMSHATCYPIPNGTATVSAAGGTTPYSYSWNTTPISNTATISSLNAGLYTVTVTDAQGCTTTKSVSISMPSAIISSAGTASSIQCFGNATGTMTSSVSGGVPPYSYSWNTTPVQTTPTATNVGAGSYILTITDANGCPDTVNLALTQPAELTVNAAISNLFCLGGSNATATAMVSGGTAPYTYSWNTTPIQTTATAAGLTVGNYMVTVTDAHGCQTSTVASIGLPSTPISASIGTVIPVSCFGTSTGSATVIATGGTTPYNYSWNTNPAKYTATASNLPAGSYTVTVTDNNGCAVTTSVTITQPATAVGATISSVINASCNSGTDGSATVSATGGVGPYTYSWNTNPIQTSATASNLAVGAYVVTVTDSKGCSITKQATITQPTILVASISASTNALCFGGNGGSATVSATGGSSPYNYSWNTSPIQIASTANNLTAGVYIVQVTDAHGCTDTSKVTISQPPALSATTTSTNLTCLNGSDGTAATVASGGTPPYSYMWNTTPTTATSSISNLPGGTYTVTVTDNHGCATYATATVAQPTNPVIATPGSIGNVSCLGGNNGSAWVIASGGVAPYIYYWNTTPAQHYAVGVGLSAGSYLVTVYDGNMCFDTATITITQPATPLTLSSTSTNTLCPGASNGTATATAAGGVAPYSYSWNTTPLQTTATATNLSAGVYTVTVTDAAGCVNTMSVTVGQPLPITVAPVVGSPLPCYGAGQGSITAYPTGGTPPYNFSWSTSPVQTSQTAYSLTAGSYLITVTDANGCTGSVLASLSQPAPLVANASTTNLFCLGGSNATSTAVVSGGVAPYTYAWNTTPAQTGATATGLTVGQYTVSVTDANGCLTTATASVGMPSTPISASTGSVSNVACFGGLSGSASALGSGGTPPYNYSWSTSPNQYTATANNLPAGTYTVTISDINGCSATASATIIQPSAPVGLAINNVANVSCNNATNGSATAAVSGGMPPYSYSWNTIPVQTTATASNLAAGTYIVLVTDASGCIAIDSITISQPQALNATAGAVNTPLCFGSLNGSATVNVLGGTAPYSYTWNTTPVQTTATATNLAGGSYTVYVIDSKGCQDTVNVIVGTPGGLNGYVTASNPVCLNGTTGTLTALVAGGTPPYNYSWNTAPVQPTSVATNLGAGTYTVVVTDNNGCTTSIVGVVAQPSNPINANIASIGNINCYGGTNGSAVASVSGGTFPYTYSWNTTPVQTSLVGNNLSAGAYILTVTDANGCVDTANAIITAPASSLNVSINNVIHPLCNSSTTGSADAVASGGTAPYVYSWNTSPSQSTATASNLPAGSYMVTVTDANGCINTQQVAITSPTPINSTWTGSGATCFGGTNSSATVNVTGGVAPYTYSWNTTPVQTTQAVSNLTAGSYTVSITDANGCTHTELVTVNQPTPLSAITYATNLYCLGGSNGSLTANVSGGTAPYTYVWATNPVQTTATANNLPAGTYGVTITDANGCTITKSDSVYLEVAPLTALPGAITNVNCFNSNDGTANVNVSGGTAPYTYNWNTVPVQTTSTATNLGSGVFTVTVTDAYGCTQSTTVTLTQPPTVVGLTLDSATHETCFGSLNGKATVSGTGGTAPYTYTWNGSPGQTAATATNLGAGAYVVTVTDANGCTNTLQVTITSPPAIASSWTGSATSCFGGANSSATVNVNGGVSPYTYSWNTTPIQTTQTVNNLAAGSYIVSITDANGCTHSEFVTVNQPTPLSATTNATNLYCLGGTNGSVMANATGGTAPYTYAWNTSPVQTTAIASNLSAGTYSVIITDANGCTFTKSDSVYLEVSPLVASPGVITNVNCYQAYDGTAAVNVSGGSAPYSYSWNTAPVQNNQTATNLGSGVFTVTVTDAYGCTNSTTVTITQPASMAALILDSLTDATCYGSSNGKASISGTGGTPPYLYAWNTNPIQNNPTATNMAAGTYMATITDARGCTATMAVTITEPVQVVPTVSGVSNALCHGDSSGSLSVVVAGGSAPYTYAWNTSPGQSTAFTSGLPAGTYQVTVTDSKGCTGSSAGTVTEPPILSASPAVLNPLCAGDGGSASVTAAGGTGPYSYMWNTVPSQTSQNVQNVLSGGYTVTVTDAHGCTTSASAIIAPAPPQLLANITGTTDVLCAGAATGSAAVAVTGGTSPYNYSWTTNPPQPGTTATNLPAGSHTVVVTDSHGCTDTAKATITEPPAIVITPDQIAGSCPGVLSGSAMVKVAGGNAPYTIHWNTTPAKYTQVIDNVIPGTYNVTVTDQNGCTKAAPVNIPTYPKPNLDAGPDRSICKGSSVNLLATGATYYFWTPNNTLSCSGCPDPIATPEDSITYAVVGINEFDCRDTDFVHVTVIVPKPVETGPERNICPGDTAMLSITGGTDYEWIPATGLSNNHSPNPIASPTETTVYTAIIKGNPCFTDTVRQTVNVYPVPTVTLGPDYTGMAGEEHQINAEVTDADYIKWSPVDLLSCSDCFNPIATLERNMTYEATVTNIAGCKATDVINIKVLCDNSLFFMPNTFTPNGDGNNDRFYPMGRGIKKVNQFSIYSRWGELLYRVENVPANQPSIGWDGFFKGMELKPDVYVYFLDATCTNDDRVYLKNDISLIR